MDVGWSIYRFRDLPTRSAVENRSVFDCHQLGSGLCGVLYVLDEPTNGLQPETMPAWSCAQETA